MKKILFVLIIALIPAFAGAKGSRSARPWEKEFKEFKLKFMAQELGLKEQQQQKFFELYGQMMDEKNKVMREAFETKRRVENMKNATDADYREASEAFSEARIKELRIEKTYDEKFATFLTQKQIFQMKEAEQKFRDRLSKMKHKGRHPKNMKKTQMKKR